MYTQNINDRKLFTPQCARSARLSISPKQVAVYCLSHVHLLVAGIDGYLIVASWLGIAGWLDVDRLLGDDRAHLVLFMDSVARDAHLACLHHAATVAVEIDAVGDQSAAEEDPINGTECSTGFGSIRFASVVVGAGLDLVADPVNAVVAPSPILYGCPAGEP